MKKFWRMMGKDKEEVPKDISYNNLPLLVTEWDETRKKQIQQYQK